MAIEIAGGGEALIEAEEPTLHFLLGVIIGETGQGFEPIVAHVLEFESGKATNTNGGASQSKLV
jgi:hypothetical protein